jgi:hypothetical protein
MIAHSPTTDASRGRLAELAGAARKRRPSNRCRGHGMLIPAAGTPAAALSGGSGERKLILERNKPCLGVGSSQTSQGTSLSSDEQAGKEVERCSVPYLPVTPAAMAMPMSSPSLSHVYLLMAFGLWPPSVLPPLQLQCQWLQAAAHRIRMHRDSRWIPGWISRWRRGPPFPVSRLVQTQLLCGPSLVCARRNASNL